VLRHWALPMAAVFAIILAEVAVVCLAAAGLGMLTASRAIPLMARFTQIDVRSRLPCYCRARHRCGLERVSAACPRGGECGCRSPTRWRDAEREFQ